jgi:hypothetical protein
VGTGGHHDTESKSKIQAMTVAGSALTPDWSTLPE